jgi:hypothetical protein
MEQTLRLDVLQEAPTIHLVGPDRVYELQVLTSILHDLGYIWGSCARLALARLKTIRDLTPAEVQIESQLHAQASLHNLAVQRLTIASPMDLVLAPEFLATMGGVGGIGYALHLMAKVLRDPHRLGGWLPGLVSSWYAGRAEVAKQHTEFLLAQQELERLQRTLTRLGAAGGIQMAEVDGVRIPDELVGATDDYYS